MRVLLDRRMTEGGPSRYGIELIRALSGLDDPIDLFQFNPRERLRFVPFTPWGRFTVARRAKRLEVDVLHCLHLELPRMKAPGVVTVHDLIPLEFPGAMRSRLKRRVFRSILRSTSKRAAAIVVPSPATARSLAGFGAPEERIRVVPHAVVGRSFSEDQRRFARGRYAGGKRYVAAVMDPKAHKNPAVLPAVAAALKELDALLVVRGKEWDAGGDVVFLPPVSETDMSDFYAGAESLLCPSFIEGFGLPALEALACGTPVVCGPGMASLEYLQPGCLVIDDVGNAGAVTDAVTSLLLDEERGRSLAAAGRRAAEELTPARMAEATVAVYRSVLSA